MAEEYGEEYEEPDMAAELAAIIAETRKEQEDEIGNGVILEACHQQFTET